MTQWRIRISLADDAQTRARLAEALAALQVTDIRLTPRASVEALRAGPEGLLADVLLELPRGAELGEMLTALHTISPQVFVSRAGAEVGDQPVALRPAS